MRITKRQLRRIIREEKASLLSENMGMSQDDAFGAGYEMGQLERDQFDYTGDLSDLTPEEAMGLGRQAAMMGLDGDDDDGPPPPHHGGGEATMTRGQLQHIAQDAAQLADWLHDEDQLPEWFQSKIAAVADQMQDMHDYIEKKSDEIDY